VRSTVATARKVNVAEDGRSSIQGCGGEPDWLVIAVPQISYVKSQPAKPVLHRRPMFHEKA